MAVHRVRRYGEGAASAFRRLLEKRRVRRSRTQAKSECGRAETEDRGTVALESRSARKKLERILLARHLPNRVARSGKEEERCRVANGAFRQRGVLSLRKLGAKRVHDSARHALLHGKDFIDGTAKSLGPHLHVSGGVNELRRHTQTVSGLLDTASEHKADTQFPPDGRRVLRRLPEAHGRRTRDHLER